jgi:hypothetical protein
MLPGVRPELKLWADKAKSVKTDSNAANADKTAVSQSDLSDFAWQPEIHFKAFAGYALPI